MRKLLEILTPENVNLEYELAGLGSRFVALVIDHLIQLGMILLIVIGLLIGRVDFSGFKSTGSFLFALGIVLIFLIVFGYFVFFEMIMNGQTPGKKAVKLRVIKQNGEPVGFLDSFLRNILRIADMLPSLYLAGAVFIVFTKHYKRIGDFAGNTIVVKVKKQEQPVTLESLLKRVPAADEGEGAPVNIYPVDNFEYGILKEFLSRNDSLGERKPVFEYHLSRYFIKKFGLDIPPKDPYRFFEEIVRLNSGI